MSFNCLILQPPLVQLNTPYPSGAYLSAFFKREGSSSKWYDLSIALISSIFCKEGLTKLFSLTSKNALSLSDDFLKKGQDFASQNVKQYVLQKDLWINSIDTIVAILKDGKKSSRELTHRFVFSPFTPRGMRTENYLQSLERLPSADDARNLASAALEDLADYISVAFDKDFSLIRYAESITVSQKSFSDIERSLNSPVLMEFFRPILQNLFADGSAEDLKIQQSFSEEKKTLVCISVPFAGTFTPALFTARFLKQKYGSKVFISFGGGFINTELREFDSKQFAKYADAISLDRGYGSYKNLFQSGLLSVKKLSAKKAQSGPLYKMRVWQGDSVIQPDLQNAQYECLENEVTSTLIPDYSDIDFSVYPRMADDTNPMQRLWSDGSWIKAYLAHGCYWHKCAFCDVTLDYVRSYRMTGAENLYKGLLEQAEQKGVYGLHFVDEALPPSGLLRFAKQNIINKSPLSFWGNVRFEKVFTRDKADFLSAGGLIGVSGGIEIATGSGLDKISKGTDLNSIVSACCAFKEAGILIHAYMIYGYFGQSDLDTINSMETLRQFFELSLLDSCFWHKFVLTRHSRIYDEWKSGLHPNLEPLEDKSSGVFAKNGLHFKGEEKSEKFGEGLNLALQSWMHGKKIGMSVNKWFNFKTPLPTVPKNLVQNAVDLYEKNRDEQWAAPVEIKNCEWLASPVVVNKNHLEWHYMQEFYSAKIPQGSNSNEAFDFCSKLSDKESLQNFVNKNGSYKKVLQFMRGKGLVSI